MYGNSVHDFSFTLENLSNIQTQVLLRWFRGLFNDANKTETGSSFNVILVLSKNEGLGSFHFKFYAMRSNTVFSGDLRKR